MTSIRVLCEKFKTLGIKKLGGYPHVCSKMYKVLGEQEEYGRIIFE